MNHLLHILITLDLKKSTAKIIGTIYIILYFLEKSNKTSIVNETNIQSRIAEKNCGWKIHDVTALIKWREICMVLNLLYHNFNLSSTFNEKCIMVFRIFNFLCFMCLYKKILYNYLTKETKQWARKCLVWIEKWITLQKRKVLGWVLIKD